MELLRVRLPISRRIVNNQIPDPAPPALNHRFNERAAVFHLRSLSSFWGPVQSSTGISTKMSVIKPKLTHH